jgi:hypothetical protein
MLTVLASQLVISAQPGIRPLENALPATTDLLFKMETVLSQSTPALSLSQTFSVKFGTEKAVLNALQEASLMLMVFVLP